MQKQYFIIALVMLFCLSACGIHGDHSSSPGNSNASAQNNSDRGKAVLQLEGGVVSVEYGRPALKERDLEKLIEPGREWRMGSNAPTTLDADIDLKFGDKTIPKGVYILKAKPADQQNWFLLIQTQDNSTIAEIPLSLERVDRSAELMTIELAEKNKGGRFSLHWGTLILSTDFQKA
jgi:Protein of unknown function (DUF2911)